MHQPVNRRKFLGLSAVGAGALVLGAGCVPFGATGGQADGAAVNGVQLFEELIPPAAADEVAPAADEKALARRITQAARQFQTALDAPQQAKAMYAFTDEERLRWHWTTPRNFPRNGLPLTEMTEEQKTLALALLQASISAAGFSKALDIMSLQRDLGNDPELYYVTLFGAPGESTPWGWRWEGHHLSHHFTVVGEQVAMTPFFLGSWPTKTDAGLRAMAREEDAALELVNSLSGSARAAAIFQERTLTRHETQNATKVSPLAPVGLAYADMDDTQQALVTEILQTYLNSLPPLSALPQWERITNAGLAQLRFGWAGSVEQRQPQYYRIQGPTFLLEFDNSRNGGIHIHSVWRDFERDFGYHLL